MIPVAQYRPGTALVEHIMCSTIRQHAALHPGRRSAPGAMSNTLWRTSFVRTRASTRVHASGYGFSSPIGGGGEQASSTVETCLSLFSERDLDGLLEYVPDQVLDTCVERVKEKSPTSPGIGFKDILEYCGKEHFSLDSYALRLLVFHQPRITEVLSSFTAGGQFFQRCRLVGSTGEEAILTFELYQQEVLEARYRGVSVMKKWFLRRVAGEPGWSTDVLEPNCGLSPELVVEAQLKALRDQDFSGVFKFASPTNQSATGPIASFTHMLQGPSYSPLINHESSEILKSMQLNATTALVVAGITSRQMVGGTDTPRRYVFVWQLGLQDVESEHPHCWMTDKVNVLSTYLSG